MTYIEQAEKLLARAQRRDSLDTTQSILAAQVMATIALAEQQRIANLQRAER